MAFSTQEYVTGSGKIDHVGTRIGIPKDSQVCFFRWLFHGSVELRKDCGNVWQALIMWHWYEATPSHSWLLPDSLLCLVV